MFGVSPHSLPSGTNLKGYEMNSKGDDNEESPSRATPKNLLEMERMGRGWKFRRDLAPGISISLIILFQLILQCISLSIRDVPYSYGDRRLSVDYYEPVFYNPSELMSQHSRKKRELGNKEELKLHLSSKSRNFRISLKEDKSVFHPEVLIENSEGPFAYDTSKLLSGHLEDEAGSHVEGVISSTGHFDGLISLSSGQEFHIEPSDRYKSSSKSDLKLSQGEGIIYERDSIQWPSQPPICPSHLLHLNISQSHTNQMKEELDLKEEGGEPLSPSSLNETIRNGATSSNRKVRRSKRYIIDPRRKTCMLYLQADHLFFRHFGSEESAINMMARHIQRVNEIYKSTDFDGDGLPDGISFMIKRIKVHNLENAQEANYRYNGDFQVIKYLERFSEGDYESFCLAYMFTFRDFEGGTLGLAWTGDLKNAGGVCERKGHFRGGLKSLNTGIITLLNYGKVVLPAVSYVTLAHEIGHNFGSPHDPESDKDCVPGGGDGNYIMYARATAGDQKNNQRFSPCSLRSIGPVLNAKAKNTHGCFTEPQKAICGNREVEEGEECDCGWEEDCQEPCCWPMKLRFEAGESPCTLKPKVDCSPSQGPCCTNNCTLKHGDKCRDDNGCRLTAFCDALSPSCPPSIHKANKTKCHEDQNVCFMGECTGSICLAYGLESCQCSPQPWDSASKMCELCCKLPGEGQPCKSSFEWNDGIYDVPDLYAKPGSPCKNYTGYCDSYRVCREVDPSGPLATLRNLLLADEGLTAIAEWIDTHWYAVISFIALLIVMMVLTAKMCGKQAKKKLRKITVMHSNVDAIQVERSYWDEGGEHVVHPAAVRKKIPLRKKIRSEKKKKGKDRSKSKVPTRASQQSSNGENKVPKYGTLWRKKRAERARLNSKNEISSAALNGSSSNNNGGEQSAQTFDLVQLQTPPVLVPSLSSNGGIYPPLVVNEPVPGPSGSKSAPVLGSKGGDPLAAALVNHHEAKTAILPQAGSRKRRGTNKKPSSGDQRTNEPRKSQSSKSHKNGVKSSRKGKEGERKGRSPRGSGSSPSTPVTPNVKKDKKSIQIVYTPPFSVKVVQVDPPTKAKNTKTSSSGGSGSNSTPSPLSDNKGANNSKVSKKEKVEGEAGGVSSAPNTPNVDGQGPPPYSKMEAPSTSSPRRGSAKQGHPSHMVKSKVKSSASFLQRRKQNLKSKSNEKSELRVLIPPANLDDDEVNTPVTPNP